MIPQKIIEMAREIKSLHTEVVMTKRENDERVAKVNRLSAHLVHEILNTPQISFKNTIAEWGLKAAQSIDENIEEIKSDLGGKELVLVFRSTGEMHAFQKLLWQVWDK